MKHKIGVIEGIGEAKNSVKQGIKVLEAIARNTNISFDFRFIKIGSKSKANETGFSEAAANCKSLDAVLVMDDIETEIETQQFMSCRAASVALQYEIETSLFDTLDKYPAIFEAENGNDMVNVDKDILKPVAAIMSIAKLVDFVGYKRFGDKIRLAAFEASSIVSKSPNNSAESKDDQLVGLVIEYINQNVKEPMISSWGEI
jgi:isocitrate/isopropylmalate dehydrogenase